MEVLDWRPFAEAMVETQIRRRKVRDEGLLAALASLPRHRFVPSLGEPPSAEELEAAYGDYPLSIGWGQTVSQPYMVARMTELLGAGPGMKVLEVGTGSGYQAAVLARLGCTVVGVERIPSLAERATRTLADLGLPVEVRCADGRLGWPPEAPYHRILVAAACPRVESPWQDQLVPGGRLVLPLETGRGFQRLLVRERTSEGFRDRWGEECRFVPLREGVQGAETP